MPLAACPIQHFSRFQACGPKPRWLASIWPASRSPRGPPVHPVRYNPLTCSRRWVSVLNWPRERCGSVWAGPRGMQILISAWRLGESSRVAYLRISDETRL